MGQGLTATGGALRHNPFVAKELPEFWCFRRCEYPIRRASFVYLAFMHEDDAVTDFTRELHLVCHHDHRHAVFRKPG